MHRALLGCVVLGLSACDGSPTEPSGLQIDDVGCAPVLQPDRPSVPFFRSPFNGSFVLGNYFDHDLPILAADTNGFHLTFCGSRVRAGADGHIGYDWAMPIGTRLFAVAGGEVIRAGEQEPAFCGSLGRTVAENLVAIRHQSPDGQVVISVYAHLDRVDVVVGQTIASGIPLGLSGNTGCSTGPHLHFGTFREFGSGAVVVDPYGWQGEDEDPWARHPDGAESVWLWQLGQAPSLTR